MSLLHPFGGLAVSDEIEEPAQESDAVPAPEPKLRGVRSESVREGAGVVVGAADCVGDDLSDRLRVIAVGEQISHDASRPGDKQAPE